MAKKSNETGGKLHLKWVRSAICAPVKQKLVIKGLGFTRLNQVIERPNKGAIRGMWAKVPHWVEGGQEKLWRVEQRAMSMQDRSKARDSQLGTQGLFMNLSNIRAPKKATEKRKR